VDVGRLIDGLCPKCFSEKFHTLEVPSKVVLILCGSCGAVKSGGGWLRNAGAVDREVLRHVKFRELPGAKSQFSLRVDLQRGEAEIAVKQAYGRQTLEERRKIKLKVRYEICDVCSRKRSTYYEAVIQIRGHSNLGYLEKRIRTWALVEEKKVPQNFLVRVVRVKNGFDVYLSSVKLGMKILSLLKREGARVQKSRKLVGQTRDGRRRYKFTYAAHF